MRKESSIYEAGHRRMAGAAILDIWNRYSRLITATSRDLDLRNQV